MATWQKVFVLPTDWAIVGIQVIECEKVFFSRSHDDEPIPYWKPRIPVPGKMIHYKEGETVFLDREEAISFTRALASFAALGLSRELDLYKGIAEGTLVQESF